MANSIISHEKISLEKEPACLMPTSPGFNLQARARQAMTDVSFLIDFPPGINRELSQKNPALAPDSSIRDLRHLLWSSIDNPESRDLDQVEFAEKTS